MSVARVIFLLGKRLQGRPGVNSAHQHPKRQHRSEGSGGKKLLL